MRPLKFTIHGREVFNVDAYEPCEGATFVVHRARYGGDWLVTHRDSTHIAHQPDINRRSEALTIAQKLHDGCPSGRWRPIRAVAGRDCRRAQGHWRNRSRRSLNPLTHT